MSASVTLAVIFASVFTLVSAARGVRLTRGIGSVPLFLAHLTMTACLWLAVPPVYYGLDHALGGVNVTNLISHLGFIALFYWGASSAARGVGREDVAHHITRKPGAWIAGPSALALTVAFILAEIPVSSMGLNEFMDQPAVVLYKTLSFVYPAWSGGMLVRPFVVAARLRPRGLQATSFALMGCGFVLLGTVPLLQLLPLFGERFLGWVDLALFPAIALVLTGASMALLSRSGQRRNQPSEQAH